MLTVQCFHNKHSEILPKQCKNQIQKSTGKILRNLNFTGFSNNKNLWWDFEMSRKDCLKSLDPPLDNDLYSEI